MYHDVRNWTTCWIYVERKSDCTKFFYILRKQSKEQKNILIILVDVCIPNDNLNVFEILITIKSHL